MVEKRHIQVQIYQSVTHDNVIFTVDPSKYLGVTFLPSNRALVLPARYETLRQYGDFGQGHAYFQYVFAGFNSVGDVVLLVSSETGYLSIINDPDGPTVEIIDPNEPVEDTHLLIKWLTPAGSIGGLRRWT